MKYINKLVLTTTIFSLLLFCFTGCQNKSGAAVSEEITVYEQSLSGYLNTIKDCAANIDGIDVNAADATSIFLENIDSINTAITGINMLSTPEGYEEVQNYSYEALNNISMAKNLYHEIYDNSDYSDYDMEKDHQAYDYYTGAINSLNKLGDAIVEICK